MEDLLDLQVLTTEIDPETMKKKEEFEDSSTCRNTFICAN